MKKEVIDKYVITTDTDDISKLVEFLRKYKISAYNYKVIYTNGKISVRAKISNNVILSIQDKYIDEAELLISKVPDSKYFIEFHNVKPENEIINLLNNLSFPFASEFHVFKNYFSCNIEKFRFKLTNLNVLEALSKEYPKIKELFPPFNVGYILTDKVLCEVGLKFHGIRNSNILQKCKYCEVEKDFVKIDNFVIKNGKIFRENKDKISKEDFYKNYE
ncbi:hypothetical protein DFR86_04385 [Acidianus sulfidivorans JP7]|uniref:Uncharacterized protein n=1 Tax=Acidianus sulfidivorans JP7 TaxID=619593 RepID=A0A2U9ILE2_9CREN|nr:hypothetical protein [Acidianus sulfidivorans]AWR96868.1 hypothetical protein DFR86_04385 [Acidianus sulfidivorans JP7]